LTTLLTFGLSFWVMLASGLDVVPSAAPSASPSAQPSISATGGQPSALVVTAVVANFSVAADLSSAVVSLDGAGGIVFDGPSGRIQPDASGNLAIPLGFGSATQPTTVTVRVHDAPSDVIQVSFYPAQYYASIGMDSGGVVDLYTTLPRADNPERSESTAEPTNATLAVDQTAWDQLSAQFGFAAGASLDDQVRQLYLDFDSFNDPAVGTVCDTNLTGIAAFEAIANHTCYVECTGLADITRDFLRSLATPSRYISLGGPSSYLDSGVMVEWSESHDTTEIWLDGQWQWLDPTLQVLRAMGPYGRVLTLEEVMNALSNSATRSELSFTRLDPEMETWVTLGYDQEDATFQYELTDYLSADKIMLIG
jgi:hypothetical protein